MTETNPPTHVRLGATDLLVSRLGFGGATIGFCERRSEADLKRVVRAAVEAGVTFFDTAPDYRDSERILGEVLADVRGEGHRAVVVATKVGRYQVKDDDGVWRVFEDWSAAGVYASLERSLAALRTDTLDLVQLHSPPLAVLQAGEALQGLRLARSDGLVRHLGVSADGEVARLALESGDFETLQLSYSVLEQDTSTLLDEARRRGVGVIAKQPVANGVADSAESPEHPDWAAKWAHSQRMDLSPLGEPGARTAGALRWLLADARVDTAIVGTSRVTHLLENVATARSPLSQPDFSRLQDEWRRTAAP